MREIKFRGKRRDLDWKYGYLTLIQNAGEEDRIAIRPLTERYITYGVDVETVGQYTGLKDKTGKDIYEGDILRRYSYADWLVIWFEGGFYLQVNNGLGSGDKYQIAKDKCEGREVIGNIYENHEELELLK